MWWDGAMNARILGQAAGPVTVKKLSDFIGETMIYYSYTVCSLEPVGPDTFGGIDRDKQTEIDGYKAKCSWLAASVAPGAGRTLRQSVAFEGCDVWQRGEALMVTYLMQGEIHALAKMGNELRHARPQAHN